MYMSELRRFLPYSVWIGKPPCQGPIYPSSTRRPLQWAILVCDRRYNLLFASWLERKPRRSQIAAFACNAGGKVVNWDDNGGRNWLYHDGCIPTASDGDWRGYSGRLQALSRLRCLHDSNWSTETPDDYITALAEWRKRQQGNRRAN